MMFCILHKPSGLYVQHKRNRMTQKKLGKNRDFFSSIIAVNACLREVKKLSLDAMRSHSLEVFGSSSDDFEIQVFEMVQSGTLSVNEEFTVEKDN